MIASSREILADVASCVEDINDPFAWRDLYLGFVESSVTHQGTRPHLLQLWNERRSRRAIDPLSVENYPAFIPFLKELFNWYFQRDLYGDYYSEQNFILSSGSVAQSSFPLSRGVKSMIGRSLDMDWYGYSDSCGRESCREAISLWENVRLPCAQYSADNVVVTMGATAAFSSLIDFFSLREKFSNAGSIICALPNYPPLLQACARRHAVTLISLDPKTRMLGSIIERVDATTPMVVLQTVVNPWGTAVPEEEIARLIRSVPDGCIVVLDESHECFGPPIAYCAERGSSNVIRLRSLSKEFCAPGLKIGWFLADKKICADFYEYASTSYGSPPSVFYLFLDALARMERWRCEGVVTLDAGSHREFSIPNGIEHSWVSEQYSVYRQDRLRLEESVIARRDTARTLMDQSTLFTAQEAPYSINLPLVYEGEEPYVLSRRILAKSQVALFPGLLMGSLERNELRMSPCVDEAEFRQAMINLSKYE